MSSRNRLVLVLCLLALFLFAWIGAQDKLKTSSLNDAQTIDDIHAYIQQEASKYNLYSLDPKKRAAVLAGILLPASNKMLEIAKNDREKLSAYNLKIDAFCNQIIGEIEKAEQKFETFLDDLASNAESKDLAEQGRFQLFIVKAMKTVNSPENFKTFSSELKTWINRKHPVLEIASLGLMFAEQSKVPAEQLLNELVEYIQSPEYVLPAEEKKEIIAALESMFRLTSGSDPKLYGKTLDDKDFDWESLRGKYVLIKFTATWCLPCKTEIPGMLKAYRKYHDKGLEIVSVYVFDRTSDSVATVKKIVKDEKLPWIILSEVLTEKAKQPKYSEFYALESVPTMVLVDKEGKIIMTDAGGNALQIKLAEIFK